jgi:hypothetical protein
MLTRANGKGIDFEPVPPDHGRNIEKGRNAYRKQLITDIAESLTVKGDIFGQSILGGDDFICWVKETAVAEKAALDQQINYVPSVFPKDGLQVDG